MKPDTTYRIVFHPLDFKKSKIILEDKRITVTSFPLLHRIPTCGFLFTEKASLPHLIKEKLDQYAIPIADRVKIKDGADFRTSEGQIILNSELVIPAVKPCSYAYCSDTAYNEDIISTISGTDLLYHEATFGNDNKSLAAITGHSTATDAATIALKAKVNQLVIGHFSARYKETFELVAEARKTFPNTEAAADGKIFTVKTSL
jgi:ribonuclease Z